MRTVIVNAKPFSRFHFGKPAIDNKTGLADTSGWLSSDALFSGLVNNVAKYRADKIVEFIQLFDENKVRISSLFYCLSSGIKVIYFLPKPVNASVRLPENTSYPDIKRIKKVRFLSKSVLENYGEHWVNHLDNLFSIGNAFLMREECDEELETKTDGLCKTGWVTHMNTRPLPEKDENTGETATPQNNLFQTAYIQMPLFRNWKTSFYFLVDDDDLTGEERKLLDFAIQLIRFEGLGGKRNVGYGWVEDVDLKSKIPFEWNEKITSSKSMTTGLLIPNNFEEFKRLDAYTLVQRGGRKIDKETTLKIVNMLAEGALLKGTNPPEGKLADISPDGKDKSFFRLGTCITLPLKDIES